MSFHKNQNRQPYKELVCTTAYVKMLRIILFHKDFLEHSEYSSSDVSHFRRNWLDTIWYIHVAPSPWSSMSLQGLHEKIWLSEKFNNPTSQKRTKCSDLIIQWSSTHRHLHTLLTIESTVALWRLCGALGKQYAIAVFTGNKFVSWCGNS